MNSRTSTRMTFFLVAAAIVAGALAYPQLPVQIASHWDAAGTVNGYMSKFWGTFFMPLVMLAFAVLALVIPKIDPHKTNISAFRKYYDWFWIALIAFLGYVYALTLAWNLGYHFNFTKFTVPAFSILFFALGILLEKSQRNWFVGVRTPWTLSSDVVWSKTNKLAGKLFRVAAVLTLLSVFIRSDAYVFLAIIIPIAAASIISIVYSYIEYQKEHI